MAMEYLNDPNLALRMFTEINPDSMDLSACNYCLSRFNVAMQAYTSINQLELAASTANRLKPYATKPAQFLRLIDYYVAMRDTNAINEIILQGVTASGYPARERVYCLMAARFAALRNDHSIRNQYAKRVLQYPTEVATYDGARAYLLINDLPNAKKSFEDMIRQFPNDPRYYGYLGVVLARNGETARARQMMDEVDKYKKPKFDYGESTYMQARIAANLGDQKTALQLCKTAIAEGFKFRSGFSFDQDPDMAVMNNMPEYKALLVSFRGKY
jgi:tetratricopeptide (TPR) repeat protein